MEDVATAEIARAQVWSWVKAGKFAEDAGPARARTDRGRRRGQAALRRGRAGRRAARVPDAQRLPAPARLVSGAELSRRRRSRRTSPRCGRRPRPRLRDRRCAHRRGRPPSGSSKSARRSAISLRPSGGERAGHDPPVVRRAVARDEAELDQRVEHVADGGGGEVGGDGELAGRELVAVGQGEEELVLGEARRPGPVRLAAAQPAHRDHRALERRSEPGDRLVAGVPRRSSRGHATLSASCADVGIGAGSAAWRAARSASVRTMQGTIAAAVIPTDHQNAVP